MEAEDLNLLLELKLLNEECFYFALDELTRSHREITPEAVAEIFDKLNAEIERMNKFARSVNMGHLQKPCSRINAKEIVAYQASSR